MTKITFIQFFQIFAFLLSFGLCQSNDIWRNPRILGGETASSISQFPWQLSLQEEGSHTCGASLITKNRALTAAHCYDVEIPVQDYSVIAGSTKKRQTTQNHSKVIRFIIHPSYNEDTNRADIAVLWLQRDFIFSADIQPVRLPKQGQEFGHGTKAFVAGWGRTGTHKKSHSSKKLKWTELKVYSNKKCNAIYKGEVLKDQLCAGWNNQERDSLKGDSGGALTNLDAIQIGIVSWGRKCDETFFPGVYTRVSYYTKWIKSVL